MDVCRTDHAPYVYVALWNISFVCYSKAEFLVEWHVIRIHSFQVARQTRGISSFYPGTEQLASNALPLTRWIDS
jgi:hypothetical protein